MLVSNIAGPVSLGTSIKGAENRCALGVGHHCHWEHTHVDWRTHFWNRTKPLAFAEMDKQMKANT